MIKFSSKNLDQGQNPDLIEDDDFENDDLITFQHKSKKVKFYYSQLTKYSKHIREEYLYSDVINRFPQEIERQEEESQLLPENVDLFFELLEDNYDIKENSKITYIECIDLLKISEFLEIRKLSSKIKNYIKARNNEIEFIIQILDYEHKTSKGKYNELHGIKKEIEQILTNKINECLSNEQFKELPIEIIYRILKNSSSKEINSNKLFDIIKESMNKCCVLFQFLELQNLSEDRLEELCELYSKSNENTLHFFDYLKCNLTFINEINKRKKNLEEKNDEQINEMKNFEKITLQEKLNESEKMNSQLQNQLNESINKMKELENQISQLQKQQEKHNQIKGHIIASVENGCFINAEISLETENSTLDTTKSKVIVSMSKTEYVGKEAYEKGEPITTHHIKTRFARKSGKYYVRCIVFNAEGESTEIVSNSVTTSGNSLAFDYEGKPSKINLPQGEYELEVWGAKGGDSTGKSNAKSDRGKQSIVQGGLGGYSRGILRLNKEETVYVFVGEEGRTPNSSEGPTTKGGFPDGGGTTTGFFSDYTTVPGTGGGSTSIRIGSETNYSRVIVAGGGGGASGSCDFVNPGGFGGGLSGGNCYFDGSLQSQGAGTQKGSTGGVGHGEGGDPGRFGSGAAGKFSQGYDSGGGGGGGWYGGGGGGIDGGLFGSARCSSGGGGSGWTFTESSLKAFQSGGKSKRKKFELNSSYYLRDVKCVCGNEEFPRPDGNGNERGHSGHGYAKITFL